MDAVGFLSEFLQQWGNDPLNPNIQNKFYIFTFYNPLSLGIWENNQNLIRGAMKF